MTRMTPGDPGPRGDRPGQVAGIGRGRVHLPVGGHDHVAHQRIMPERAAAGADGLGLDGVASRSRRSSARWTAERWISSRSASSARLASGVSRRASATSRTTYGCVREPAVGVERRDGVELAAGGADRALEVRRLGVEDPVELAAQRPRDLPRLELEQRPGAPIRRRNVPTASPFFEVTTPRPRRSRHETGSPKSVSRAASSGASSGSTTNSRWVRPPARLSEPRARNRPRSQAARQWSAAGSPGRTARAGAPRPRAAGGGAASRATDASRPVGAGPEAVDLGDAVAGRDGSIAASSSRRAVTRSRSDRVTRPRQPRAATHPRTSQALRLDARPVVRRRIPASPSKARMSAAASRAGSWWWALSGSTTSSRTSRGTGGDDGGQRSETASRGAASPAGSPGRGRRMVVGQHDVDESGLVCADQGLDVRGQVEAGRLAVLRGHVADEDPRRAARATRRGWPG